MALPHVVLGIARDASMEEVVKAYRSKAMKMHPDRGGDPDEFHKLQAAYNALRTKHEPKGGLFDDLISTAAEENKSREWP